jgi:cytochrome P450
MRCGRGYVGMRTDAALASGFDLRNLPESFYENPFPAYAALREHAPVKQLPGGGVFLSRYADVLQVYNDPAVFSSDKTVEFGVKYGKGSRLFRHHTTSLVFNDAPYHTRVRRTILGAMVPKALAPLEPKLIKLVERLLDVGQARGRMDAIADFAGAIPVEVIGDLLAVPDADRGPLRGWSLAILGALEPVLTAESFDRGERALDAFHAYLTQLIAGRRNDPGDPERDVLTRLLQSGEHGEPLSDAELVENCVFLLNAGHETTSNLIGNAIELFARVPEERARLIANPELMRSAVEELLRYESSNQLGNRITTRDTEIGGAALPAGCFVTLGVGAANRDAAAFAEPDRFDIARRPNRHLAFAAGPHQCAGMNLARLEGRIALGAFLARFPDYVLAAPPVRSRRARFRGFTSMPLRLR